MKMFDFYFKHTSKGYLLGLGNSKFIKLTDEQAKELGYFAVEEEED